MAIVRAKFVCHDKQHDTATPDQGEVVLEAVTGGSPENESFYQYTPSGRLTMGILSPGAFAFFEPGKEYMIDFTLAEEATPPATGG